MKLMNGVLLLTFCITFYFGLYTSLLLFTSLPIYYESRHIQVVETIRESDFDDDQIQMIQDEHTTIKQHNALFYEVKSVHTLHIPLLEYTIDKINVSYVYQGE